MNPAVQKYGAIFKAQLSNRLTYPLDLLVQSISIGMFMWIFLQLWKATYHSLGQTTIGGLTLYETLWYLMLAETITLSKPRLARIIAESVRDGSIAYVLNKPYNYLLYNASLGLGDSISHMIFNLLVGGVMTWLMVGPPPDPRGWPFVLAAMILAWMIDFCFAALLGLAAFYTEDIAAFEWIYSKILLLLGGVLIPLDFFPAGLQSIAKMLPFAYTIYGPARLFVDPQIERAFGLFIGQILWLAVMSLIVIAFYRKGVMRLNINGG